MGKLPKKNLPFWQKGVNTVLKLLFSGESFGMVICTLMLLRLQGEMYKFHNECNLKQLVDALSG